MDLINIFTLNIFYNLFKKIASTTNEVDLTLIGKI